MDLQGARDVRAVQGKMQWSWLWLIACTSPQEEVEKEIQELEVIKTSKQEEACKMLDGIISVGDEGYDSLYSGTPSTRAKACAQRYRSTLDSRFIAVEAAFEKAAEAEAALSESSSELPNPPGWVEGSLPLPSTRHLWLRFTSTLPDLLTRTNKTPRHQQRLSKEPLGATCRLALEEFTQLLEAYRSGGVLLHVL